MKKILLILCAFSLAFASHSFAADGSVSGNASLGIRYVDVDNNSAKFTEYRDLSKGAYGNIFLDYDSEGYHLSVLGTDIGLTDQYYRMSGGKWGLFKYSIFYNEIPHNYSFGAKTFYANPGSSDLTYGVTDVPKDPNVWSTFDYKIERKDFGASIDLTLNSPFFVNLSADQLTRKGVYPIGAPSGVNTALAPSSASTFGNMVELPELIDNKTNNVTLTAGYRTKPLYLALTGTYSKFDTTDDFMSFRNPYVTALPLSETISLPPDNNYWKIKFTGSLKLPLDSDLAVNAGYSKLTDDVQLLNRIWTSTPAKTATGIPTYTLATLGLSDSVFNGDIRHTNFGAVLTSNPVKPLYTKVYYKYLKKENKNDEITYTSPDGSLSSSNDLFNYEKDNAGLEAGYKFTRDLKLTAGYDYLRTKRERIDFLKTTDNTFFAQVRYSPLDFLSGRIKYQRLQRSSPFGSPDLSEESGEPGAPEVIELFLRRFDAASKDQDALKLSIDISPIETLDITAEYAYKKDKYKDISLGMKDSTRNEFILDGSYYMGAVNLYGYFDYEEVKTNQTSRSISPTGNFSFDPASNPVANSYNWDVTLKDKNYAAGAGAELPLIAKALSFAVQYDYQKADGNADFTSQILTGKLTQDSIDISSYDDYTKHTVSAKLKYKLKENLKFILGYLYEQLKYSDAQFDGYKYYVADNSYLTGAYLDQNYKANVVYLKAVYNF